MAEFLGELVLPLSGYSDNFLHNMRTFNQRIMKAGFTVNLAGGEAGAMH